MKDFLDTVITTSGYDGSLGSWLGYDGVLGAWLVALAIIYAVRMKRKARRP